MGVGRELFLHIGSFRRSFYIQNDPLETAVAAAGGEYVAFTGEEAVAGMLLEKLSPSSAFVNLLHQVYEQGSGHAAPNPSVFQVLRCLKGKSGPEARASLSL